MSRIQDWRGGFRPARSAGITVFLLLAAVLIAGCASAPPHRNVALPQLRISHSAGHSRVFWRMPGWRRSRITGCGPLNCCARFMISALIPHW